MRKWAIEKEKIIVITGPVLSNNLKTIGKNQVSIPEYFYKILLCPNTLECTSFFMENCNELIDFRKCVVSIDSIENITIIEFFPNSKFN